MNNEIGKQRIEIVRKQQVGFVKYQKQKQPDIKFGIKQRPFFKQQFHPFHLIISRWQWQTITFYAANQKNIKTQPYKCIAGFVYALVGHQVVDYRNDCFFQIIIFEEVRN
jgi:hypothetical protein